MPRRSNMNMMKKLYPPQRRPTVPKVTSFVSRPRTSGECPICTETIFKDGTCGCTLDQRMVDDAGTTTYPELERLVDKAMAEYQAIPGGRASLCYRATTETASGDVTMLHHEDNIPVGFMVATFVPEGPLDETRRNVTACLRRLPVLPLELEAKTVSGRNILREYNDLKALGYKTVFAGEGQIRLEHPDATQPYQVRTGCGHVVTRRMRPSTAGVPYTPETVIEAPNGRPCPACEQGGK